MSNLLGVVQEAVDHGEAVAEVGGPPDISSMLMHHITDSHELDFDLFFTQVHISLPQWAPIHLGPLTLDLSPTKHVVFLLVAAVICFVVFTTLARVVQAKDTDRAPSGFANAFEVLIVYFRDEVARANIGHGADAYVPYILTLFFFVLAMNLMGLVPWGSTPTGNVSVTGALALTTFVVVEVSGFRSLGPAGYARTIFYAPDGLHPGMKAMMLVIMTPVEFMGKLAKPFALTIRLFANMTAGHTVVLSLIGLIFVFSSFGPVKWGVAGVSVGMAVAIMVLEIFVAFLQAYIFAMLTSVFIGLIRHAH